MRKAILSVLVTLAVTAFVISGCKKSQPEPTTPAEKKATQPAIEKKTAPPVEKPAEK